MSRIGKYVQTENRLVVVKGWGCREWGVTANEYQGFLLEDENVLELDGGDGCTQNFMNTLKITKLYLKRIDFTAYESYLNFLTCDG